MTGAQILDLWRNALTVIVEVSAPFLIAALGVGLAVSIVQTATQLQESTISFVPKLAAAIVAVALSGHWCLDRLGKFTTDAFTAHAQRNDSRTPAPPLAP
ncbi:MAG: flagellar biosynthetic protein FliQ [Kofleriaceae bacterium]